MNLFDKNARYTNEAFELDKTVSNLLQPLFDEWVKKGYSPREVSHLLIAVVKDLEHMSILTSMSNEYQR